MVGKQLHGSERSLKERVRKFKVSEEAYLEFCPAAIGKKPGKGAFESSNSDLRQVGSPSQTCGCL